ncbi:MFS transporter [Hamadaea tsunoensis]|uniref:MFS transporter n=1 Tax=Hamadaea tsunoensis TaxID=53368 RepID=UPI0004258E5B|nr:MFS transporter [Hamadaea tsunoensis]
MRTRTAPALTALALGYFALGTTSLSVVGLNRALGAAYGVPAASIGFLVTFFALTFAVAAPLAAVLLRRSARRRVLLAGLTLLTVGSAAAALAPTYATMAGARVLAAIGAAIFGPAASAAGAALVPPERRGQALAVVFGGMTAATVLGIPLVSLLGTLVSRRGALGGVAVLAAVSVLLVFLLVRDVPAGPAPTREAYRAVLRSPGVPRMVATTLLFMAAQFTVYGVAGAYLAARFGAADGVVSAALLVFGIVGVLGNAVAAPVSARLGGYRTVGITLAGLAAAFAGLAAAPRTPVAGVVLFAGWAFFSQLYQVPQQARLVGRAPEYAGLTLALNASALYIGMSVGSLAGGALLGRGAALLPPVALAVLAAAAVVHLSTRESTHRKATTMQPNAQLVADYLEIVWNQGRTDRVAEFVADDLAQHNPNLPDGRTPLAELVDGIREKMPQGRFELRRIAAEGDLVFAHSHFTAGEGDRGTAVVDVFRVEGGRIAEHWDVKEDVPETTASGRPII